MIINNNNNNINHKNKNNRKIKLNLPIMGKLKLIKCERINNNNKISLNMLKRYKCNTNRDLVKKNYSYKEIRNLSKNSKSNKYIYIKHFDKKDEKNVINTSNNDNSINNNFNDFKLKKYLIDNFNKKNRSNHNFYESKSFSLQNKLINQNIKNIHYKTILNGNITPNSNRIFVHQYSFKTFGVNKGKNNEYIKNSNSNNNIYTVNTSFNTNIYKYNNN